MAAQLLQKALIMTLCMCTALVSSRCTYQGSGLADCRFQLWQVRDESTESRAWQMRLGFRLMPMGDSGPDKAQQRGPCNCSAAQEPALATATP